MVQALENLAKSMISADKVQGIDEKVEEYINETLIGAVSTITTSDLESDKILTSNLSGKVAVTNISSSELTQTLSYLDGVTENIQEQIDNKPNHEDVVHKAGNETITGFKTIENNISLKDTQGTIGITTNQWAKRIQFTDSTGARIARLEPKYVDATTLEMGLYASNGLENEAGIYVRNDGSTYAPTPLSTSSTTATNIATTGWVNNPDASVNVVHKTSEEEITGVKTINGTDPKDTTFYTDGIGRNSLYIKNNESIADEIPTTANGRYISFTDKNGVNEGYLEFWHASSGQRYMAINVCKNGTSDSQIAIGYDNNDEIFTVCPTPKIEVKGNYIVNAAWIESKFKVVSALPASPDSNVYYMVIE